MECWTLATATLDAPRPLEEGRLELACFRVSGQLFGLEVSRVRQILRSQPTTPLPRAPELIEGVVDLRGSVVPVIDLARALGLEPGKESPTARIALVEFQGLVFGLRVDAAVDVVTLDGREVEDPPALVKQTGYRTVRAVVRRPDLPPVLVISLEALLDRVADAPGPGRGECP